LRIALFGCSYSNRFECLSVRPPNQAPEIVASSFFNLPFAIRHLPSSSPISHLPCSNPVNNKIRTIPDDGEQGRTSKNNFLPDFENPEKTHATTPACPKDRNFSRS